MFNYVHSLVKAAMLIFGICASLQSRMAGMAVITRVLCDFKASKKMPTKPEVSPWPQSPVSICVLGGSGQGWEQGCSIKVS